MITICNQEKKVMANKFIIIEWKNLCVKPMWTIKRLQYWHNQTSYFIFTYHMVKLTQKSRYIPTYVWWVGFSHNVHWFSWNIFLSVKNHKFCLKKMCRLVLFI